MATRPRPTGKTRPSVQTLKNEAAKEAERKLKAEAEAQRLKDVNEHYDKVKAEEEAKPFNEMVEASKGYKTVSLEEQNAQVLKNEDLTPTQERVVSKPKQLGRGITLTQPTKNTGALKMLKEYQDSADITGFIEAHFNLKPADYPFHLKNLIRGIEQYINNMRSGVPMEPVEGAKHQATWVRTVTGALDCTLAESNVAMSVLMYVVHNHRVDLFNDRLACRFYNLLQPNTQDLFLHIQKDLMGAANPLTRDEFVRNTILDNTARLFAKEHVRANYLAFFSDPLN